MPSLMIMLAWILFGASHFTLSHTALRHRIIARYGKRKFTILYSAITIISLGILIAITSIYGDEGRPGLNLANNVLARWILGGISFLGAVLIMAGLFNYPNSPMAVLAQRERRQDTGSGNYLRPPTAIDGVTRHPFFVGLSILMAAHALLAGTMAGAFYFAGFSIISSLGIFLQDRKLRRRWQDIYVEYENNTSAIPFMNRQKENGSVQRDGLRKWVISTLIAIVFLGFLHPVWSYASGAPFAGFVLLFGMIGVFVGLRKSAKQSKD